MPVKSLANYSKIYCVSLFDISPGPQPRVPIVNPVLYGPIISVVMRKKPGDNISNVQILECLLRYTYMLPMMQI